MRSEEAFGRERFLAPAEHERDFLRVLARRLQPLDRRDELGMPWRLVANGIGRSRILRQHVRLAAATAEILFLLGAARARLLHPAGAAKAVETFRFVPDRADLVLAHAWKREARQ